MSRPPTRVTLRDALDSLTASTRSAPALQKPEVSVFIYGPPAADLQSPHPRAETYIVLQGSGTLTFGTRSVAVAPSDLIHVPAGLAHRFRVDEGGPLVVWAVFAGPDLDGLWTPDPGESDLEEMTITFPGGGAEVAEVSGGGPHGWKSAGLGTVAGLVIPRLPSAEAEVGSVAYELTTGGSELAAAWAHPDIGAGMGTGSARRVDAGTGFEGTWDIQYRLPDGAPLPRLDLSIRPRGDIFLLEWRTGNTLVYEGMGIIRDDTLIAGWAKSGSAISFLRVEPDLEALDHPPSLKGTLVTSAGAREISFVRGRRD